MQRQMIEVATRLGFAALTAQRFSLELEIIFNALQSSETF
jgi:hypothetical protein